MKVLLIDNFDSFVYNIYQYLGELGCEVDIVRNNAIGAAEAKGYDRIVISPGPGNPENERDFGICREVILNADVPLLGVCLGHQGIVSSFGGRIVRTKPMHGKMSVISHDGKGIFAGVSSPLMVMRYHSLAVEESSLPECLEITAKSEDDELVMAVRHKSKPIYGVQFHPESILTEEGKKLLKNFIGDGDE